jgi:hypothetical protein
VLVATHVEQRRVVPDDVARTTIEAEVERHAAEVRFGRVISRRALLAGAASTALLAACGSSEKTGTAAPTTDAPSDPSTWILGAGFAEGYAAPTALAAGLPQRGIFIVMEANRRPVRDNAPDSVDIEILRNGTSITKQRVPRHNDGIPTPYYPVVFTPDAPGDYQAKADFTSQLLPFKVSDRSQLKLVQVGEPMRPLETPTTSNARGVNPVCTRTPNACPFHQKTLTEALHAGKPVAFIISTPGYCQTAICGPVLELLIDESKSRPNFEFVHAEVYVDPAKVGSGNPQTTDAISTYGLDFEPSLAIANASGVVTARLDFSWDRSELQSALATAA